MPVIDPSGSSTPAASNLDSYEQNITDTSATTEHDQAPTFRSKKRNSAALNEAENEKFNAVCEKLLASDDGDQAPYKNYGE